MDRLAILLLLAIAGTVTAARGPELSCKDTSWRSHVRNWNYGTEGEVLHYFCKTGYSPINNGVAQCIRGRWVNMTCNLNKAYCNNENLPIGLTTVNLKGTFGEEVSYSCDYTYNEVASKAECSYLSSSHGFWRNLGCIPKPGCRMNETDLPANANWHYRFHFANPGTVQAYSCGPLTLVARGLATCSEVTPGNFQWTNIECIRKTGYCDHWTVGPGVIWKREFGLGRVGTQLSFKCKNGYVGGGTTTCTENGPLGIWKGMECREVGGYCDRSTVPSNVEYYNGFDNKKLGDKARGFCSSGYLTRYRRYFTVSTCVAVTSTHGKWSILHPCELVPVYCTPNKIQRGLNTHLAAFDNKAARGPINAALNFTCPEGYEAENGGIARCAGFRPRYGIWKGLSCKKVTLV